MTSVVFWELMTACLLLWGNAYCRITWSGNSVVDLAPIKPDRISAPMRRDDGSIFYRVQYLRSVDVVEEREIMHVRGFTLDGMIGMSVIHQARETLGLAMAAEKTAASTFRNGMRPSVAFVLKDYLDAVRRKRWDDELIPKLKGSINAGQSVLLEGGMDVKTISMNPADAELMVTREFSVEQICRWFGVQPVMIGHMEKSTAWGCLPGDTMVFTENGPVPIERVEPGVKVWSFDGDHKMVLSSVKARIMTGYKPIRELRTASRTLRVTDNHVVFVRRYFGRAAGRSMGDCAWKNLWVRADEVRKGDWLAVPHCLPDVSKAACTTPDGITLTVGLMELAGLYTGDGSSDRNRIEFAHERGSDYIGYYADAAREAFDVEPYCDGRTGTRTRFSSAHAIAFLAPFMGTSHTKRVPSWVFNLRRDLIAAYLRGYVDSDGCVCRGRIEYASCNKALLEDIRHLAMLIGVPTGRVKLGRKAGSGFIRGQKIVQGQKYVLSFSSVTHNQIIGSNSATKASKFRTQTERTLSYDAGWDRDWRLEGRHNSQSPGFGFNVEGLRLQRVREVAEPSEELIPVYDIEVCETASFIADGVLVHNSGLEQMNLWFLTYTLRPILRSFEQAVSRSLLSPVQQMTQYAEFNVEGLMRADSAGRAALMKVLASEGLRTRNELRALNNFPPLPGGDDLTVMSNMLPVQLLGQIARMTADKIADPNFKPTPTPANANVGTENAS